MVRTDKTLSNNGSKKPSNSSDCDNEYVTSESDATPTTETRESVHKQNLYIVSFPIILLFNILRSILYQFFIVFKYIFNVSSHFLHHPLRKRDKNTSANCVSHSNVNEALLTTERRTAVPTVMPLPIPQQSTGPGPGDPMLAKQKHHHRRAFEYISKALKIDEENEGKRIKGIFPVLPLIRSYSVSHIKQVKKKSRLNCIERVSESWSMVLLSIAGEGVVKSGNGRNVYTTKCKPIYRWPEIAYTFSVSSTAVHFMQLPLTLNAFLSFAASGQKLIVINKRGNSSLVNKSQTLPRSMGSRVATTSEPSRHQRLPIKPATTPPVIRRQFSVSNLVEMKRANI